VFRMRCLFSLRFLRIPLFIFLTAAPVVAQAGDLPLWPLWRTNLMSKFTLEMEEVKTKMVKNPDSPVLYARRGDLNLFLAHFPEAVADFEKMDALAPTQANGDWRLGIAYQFNGDFEKSARQFERYDSFDNHDRENGIWRFLAQVKTDGLAKARSEMLLYAEFDREPFPELYDMFAGKKTTDEMLAEIEKKGLMADPQVNFFANYYAGLNEDVLGHRPYAIRLLRKAVDVGALRETVYMWNCCRLRWEQLVKEEAAAH
jgi:lipoprotein NlpI